MTIEISHTQHPTSKTMYIFFYTDKNYDYKTWSFFHPHDILWSNGAEIPTSAPERTPLSSSAVHGSVFIRRISGVLGLRSLVPESSERWEICKLWFIAAHGS